jgi:hypothetical protein
MPSSSTRRSCGWTRTLPTPTYKVDDGDGKWHWDLDAYERDRQAAAITASSASYEIVRNLRNNNVVVGVPGITRQQFLDYTDVQDKAEANFVKGRQGAIDAYFNLPPATDSGGNFDQGRQDARDAALAKLKTDYGDGVLDKNYTDVPSADVLYNQGGKAIATYYYALTPGQKSWFKDTYGSAFHDEPGPDGSTRSVFDPKSLSTEQVKEIVAEQGLDIFGDINTRTEVQGQTGQISPYTMNKVATQAAQQAMSDQVYALQQSYYDGAGLTAEQINANTEWHAFLDRNSTLEQQASDIRGPAGDYQPSWEQAYDLAVKQYGEHAQVTQYIAARIDLSKRLDVPAIYDAQTTWWHTLDPENRKLLMREAPDTFGRYSTEPSDQAYLLIKEYNDGAGLTTDQQANVKSWQQYLLNNSAMERAANELRQTGEPTQLSWKATIKQAQSNGMYDLADYITARQQTFADLAMGETYDAQRAWWASLTDDQRTMLQSRSSQYLRLAQRCCQQYQLELAADRVALRSSGKQQHWWRREHQEAALRAVLELADVQHQC